MLQLSKYNVNVRLIYADIGYRLANLLVVDFVDFSPGTIEEGKKLTSASRWRADAFGTPPVNADS